jgi:hypothetical protein
MDVSKLRPFRRWGLLLAAVPCTVLFTDARALDFIPEDPDHCDIISLSVTRSFTSDCGWSASAETTVEGSRVEVFLTPGRLSERCLPVVREYVFEVAIGALPPGEYEVTLRWTDRPEQPAMTDTLSVADGGTCRGFIRGDANADLATDISDGIGILRHLFLGSTIDCLESADADGSGAEEVTDAIFLFNFLFAGGAPPPAPFPECGQAPGGGPSLGCANPYCHTGRTVEEELVWMSRPDGCVQCAPCNAPSLEDVVRELEESGIDVEGSSFIHLLTCLACDVCPSGRQYLVLVPVSDVASLASMGWTRWVGLEN